MTPDQRVGPHAMAVFTNGGSGDRVVLVHGTMDRSTSLAKVSRRLANLEVLRYDRRGYGDSSAAPAAGTVEEHVEDLLLVLGERPAVVVGHSMGGTIALAAAARRPELVRGVGAYEAPRPWAPWWPGSSPGGAAVAVSEPAEAAEAFMRRLLGDEVWERLPDRTKARRRAEGAALLADMTSIRREPPYLDTELRVPVMAAHGSESIERHVRTARELAESVQFGSVRVIEGASHGAHITHPDAFAGFVHEVVTAARSHHG